MNLVPFTPTPEHSLLHLTWDGKNALCGLQASYLGVKNRVHFTVSYSACTCTKCSDVMAARQVEDALTPERYLTEEDLAESYKITSGADTIVSFTRKE